MQTTWIRVLAIGAIVLLLDQASKLAVIDGIARGDRVDLAFGIDLVHTTNRGVAFGMFSRSGVLVPLLSAAVLIGVLAWFHFNRHLRLAWLATGLVVGGAVGNLLDRVRLGAVTDFISAGSWPPFNLADSAITCGVVILIVITLMEPQPKSEGSRG